MWYVLQVKTGDEIKVRDALLAKGVRALVPQESRMIRKDGKWGRRLYTLIPSYVLSTSNLPRRYITRSGRSPA